MRKTFGQLKLAVARMADNITQAGQNIAGDKINSIIETMMEERDWSFFRIRSATITLDSTNHTYDLPSTFDRVDKVYYKDTDGEFRELDPLTDDRYFELINEDDPDDPRFFRFLDMDSTNLKPRIQIGPRPSSSFLSRYGTSLYLEIYQDVTALALDATYPAFPGRFTKIIEYGAAALMCADQADTTKQQSFYTIYQTMLDRKILQDKDRYREMLIIKPIPSSTIYPQRTGRSAGRDNDYGD